MEHKIIVFNKLQRERFLKKLIKKSEKFGAIIIERSYLEESLVESLTGFTHFLNYKESGRNNFIFKKKKKSQKTKRRYLIEGFHPLNTMRTHHLGITAYNMLKGIDDDGENLASSYIYLYYYFYFDKTHDFFAFERKKWEASLGYHEWERPILLVFLSIIFEKICSDDIIVNYINRVEDSLPLENWTSEDMPYFQFSRWLMLYSLTKEKPNYKIKSALFSSIVDHWDNDELFLQAIFNILDHHLAECMELREVELEHTRYYDVDEHSFISLFDENRVIPLEVLALRQLRLSLGLYWPERIDHPLMFDGLYEMVDKAKAQVDSINNELLETIQKVLESDDIPSKAEIIHAINTVPLYEPEDDDW